MENYVNLDRENTLKLYHYCTEIADALRPFLNTPDIYSQADPAFWLPKLTEFKEIIRGMLPPDMKMEFSITPEFIKEAHLRIFSNILSQQNLNNLDSFTQILMANNITKQAIKELYGVEL